MSIRPEPYMHCILCDEKMQGILSYDTATQRVFCWQCEQARKEREDEQSTQHGE